MRDNWFHIYVYAHPNISQKARSSRIAAAGFGWTAEPIDLGHHTQNLKQTIVVRGEDTVYLSRDVCKWLGVDVAHQRAAVRVGQRGFFALADLRERIKRSINYPTRSKREELVAQRNGSLFEWLCSQEGPGGTDG